MKLNELVMQKVGHYCIKNNVSLTEFGRRMQGSRTNFYYYTSGKCKASMTLSMAVRIARVMDITLDRLTEGADEWKDDER